MKNKIYIQRLLILKAIRCSKSLVIDFFFFFLMKQQSYYLPFRSLSSSSACRWVAFTTQSTSSFSFVRVGFALLLPEAANVTKICCFPEVFCEAFKQEIHLSALRGINCYPCRWKLQHQSPFTSDHYEDQMLKLAQSKYFSTQFVISVSLFGEGELFQEQVLLTYFTVFKSLPVIEKVSRQHPHMEKKKFQIIAQNWNQEQVSALVPDLIIFHFLSYASLNSHHDTGCCINI